MTCWAVIEKVFKEIMNYTVLKIKGQYATVKKDRIQEIHILTTAGLCVKILRLGLALTGEGVPETDGSLEIGVS